MPSSEHGRHCGWDLGNCPDRAEHRQLLSGETPSPHYPRKIANDLIVKRQKSGAPGGFSYAADFTDGYHTTILAGPYRDTEIEALHALGISMSLQAEKLRVRSVELQEMEK